MFSIEDLIEKIYEPKTKDLFKEVYKTYTQEQYRATVVMLWTVVVCDLVYKLQDLRDIYNDKTAISILDDISKQQAKDPKNPAWETSLLKQVREKTKFIDQIEKEALEYLQKNRNLCAHPIITSDNILFKPSKEMTRALMRTALEAILLKTPLLSKEYKIMILEDFENKKEIFEFWDENAERYFENRYLNHLNIEQILSLFKLLWKVVFLPKDERENNNLMININLLEHIFSKYPNECINFMRKSIDYFSYDNTNINVSYQFDLFIIKYSGLYEILSEQTKSIFKSSRRNFAKTIPLYFITEFSIKEYMELLTDTFKNRKEVVSTTDMFIPLIQLQSQAKSCEEMDAFYNLCVDWYTNSWTYDEANLLFNLTIRQRYKKFNIDKIIKFIKQSSKNSQTFNRNRANEDHKLIVQRFIELNGSPADILNTPFEELYIELGGVSQ